MTLAGKKCTICDNPATLICQIYVLARSFCIVHGKVHGDNLWHQLSKSEGTYMEADRPYIDEKDVGRVLMSHDGCRYTDHDLLIEDGIWLPMTPSRSTVFLHYKLMKLAQELMLTAMLSVDMIINIVEKQNLCSLRLQ